MSDSTLRTIFYAAIDRIQKLEASDSDLALVFVMAEFIDALDGTEGIAKITDRLEAKWKIAQGEYARGEV